MDWLKEQFDLLNRGGGMVITALFRLALLGGGIWLAWYVGKNLIQEFFRRPVAFSRAVLAIALALVIGFGTIIFVPKYLFPVEGWGVAILWLAGWIVAGKMALLVGGFDDKPTQAAETPSSPPESPPK